MNSKVKLFAMYLPQYHCIPENDLFWGKGFTDWVTVKKAKPLFKGHNQPKIPLNENYYDLSKEENIIRQANLAHQYGITGFGIYHYWFNSEKNLLTKPTELIRDNKNINIKYFLAWDNANWKRSWSNVDGNAWSPLLDQTTKTSNEPAILVPYILGNEADWEKHYNYVRTHFLNEKYERIENKPIFLILQYSKEIVEMCNFWNKLAQNDGFDGIFVIFKNDYKGRIPKSQIRYNYEPIHSGWWANISLFRRAINKIFRKLGKKESLGIYDYDTIWKRSLKYAKKADENTILGAFVSYDDTPRRGKKGKIIIGSTAKKFGFYLKKLVGICSSRKYPYIFITAWNEWGEGAYLEPDNINKYENLEAISNALNEKK